MKSLRTLVLLTPFILFLGCTKKNTSSEPTLISIQIVDRNGFAETISSKDRLTKYEKTNFYEPQAYQKILRVFEKNKEGQSSSCITSYHGNGYIKQALEVVNGRAHGSYKEWHPNGHLKMDFSVIEGIADLSDKAFASWVFEGENKIFDEKGYLLAQIPYEKGVLHGNSTYYYPTKKKKKILPYHQDQMHGTALYYNESGEVLESVHFVHDKKQGKAFGLTKEKAPLYEELFLDDLLLEASYYNSLGEKIADIQEGFGKKAEFENGKLKTLIEYKKGLPEGLVEQFNPYGFLSISFMQKEGKKHGEEKEYYLRKSQQDPYQEKILVTWHEDVLQGPVKTWFADGKQESQKEMYQNKKNGPSLAWYKQGDILLVEEYENDLLTNGSYYKKGDKKPVSRVIQGKGVATLYDAEGHFLKKISYEKGLPILESK